MAITPQTIKNQTGDIITKLNCVITAIENSEGGDPSDQMVAIQFSENGVVTGFKIPIYDAGSGTFSYKYLDANGDDTVTPPPGSPSLDSNVYPLTPLCRIVTNNGIGYSMDDKIEHTRFVNTNAPVNQVSEEFYNITTGATVTSLVLSDSVICPNDSGNTSSYTPVYTTVTGPLTLPSNMRHYAISVLEGPVIINGETVPVNYNSSVSSDDIGGFINSITIDGTGGKILLTTII